MNLTRAIVDIAACLPAAAGALVARRRPSLAALLRRTLRRTVGRLRRNRPRAERVLILGTSPLAREIVEAIEARNPRRQTVVGVVGETSPCPDRFLGKPILGALDRLDGVIESCGAERIVVSLEERRGRLPFRHLLRARLRSIAVETGEEFYERLTGKVAIESLTPSRLVFSNAFRLPVLSMALGRALSFLASSAALAGLLPLMAVIAVAIKLDSGGPVFFIQDRVGVNGRRFRLIKFRTMQPANGETSEWARDNGHRVTRLGKWLRRYRLDELPQLLNVLRGEMNLVGPRPHPASNFTLLATVVRNAHERGTEIPYYSLRSSIPPGITGWAQVRYGYANGIEEEIEKLKYDLYYVKNLSLRLDLRILLETVRVVLLGRVSERDEPRPAPAPAMTAGEWRDRVA